MHSRLKTISTLGLERFGPTLKRLCLRQNHIKTLDLEVMKALVNLTELDMYDNKIKDVGEALDLLVNITYVVHLPARGILEGYLTPSFGPLGRSICHLTCCERSQRDSGTFKT